MSHRRDSQDKEWQAVKQFVYDRDKGTDRIVPVLRIQEAHDLRRNAGHLLQILDPAHVVPVSKASSMCYDEDNVILLNRYSHDNLDHNRCPVTGRRLTRNQVHQWWARIVGVQKYKELLDRARRHI